MSKILLLSHGNLAFEMKKTVEMIYGKTETLVAFKLPYNEDITKFQSQIQEFILKHESSLIILDIFGGTPSMILSKLYAIPDNRNRIEVITGMSLPMVLEILPQLEVLSLFELKNRCLNSGIEGIKDFRNIFEIKDI